MKRKIWNGLFICVAVILLILAIGVDRQLRYPEICFDKAVDKIDMGYYACVPINTKSVSIEDAETISEITSCFENTKATHRKIEDKDGCTVYVFTVYYIDGKCDEFSIIREDNVLRYNNHLYDVDVEQIDAVWEGLNIVQGQFTN